MCIWFRAILLQLRVIHNDHLVCPVLSQLIRKALYAAAYQYGSHFRAKGIRQVFSFADQLKGNAVNTIVYLLRKDIYAFIFL
jgi:hypothetical protein